MRTTRPTTPTLYLTLICAAALSACGGGGGDNRDNGTSIEAATAYSANGTLISDDATDALDTGVQTAQTVVSTQAAAAADSRAHAQSATAAGVTNAVVNCLGGGTASVTITGGTAESTANGQLDAGEVYQITYAGCRRATGVAALTGTLTMTVVSASASDLSLTLATTDLSAALPRGTVTVSGSTAHSISSAAGANGATVVTNHFSTPNLTLATQFNARQSSFTLSAVDITRTSTWLNGVLQSSTLNGTHTLSATLPNGAFSYTVATQGGVVTYSASGVPTSGAWAITLPRTLVNVSIAAGVATITVDDGKDGTIDRTFTVTVGNLQTAAG